MITESLFYLAAIPAVLIVGISKGGFGGSLGLVAVPMMALVIAPSQAAAIMLPILCVMDLVALWGFRSTFDKKNLLILLPAACLGILAGTTSFHLLNEDHIKLLIGATTLVFCLNWLIQTLFHPALKAQPANILRGSIWGVLAGFTSFSVHAGGPPLNFYLLPQQLDKRIFVSTTIIFFAVVNYLKLIPYSMLGLLPEGNLITSLILIPLAPIGVKLGIYLHNKINTTLFYKICYLFLFITGCKLSWEGLNALL